MNATNGTESDQFVPGFLSVLELLESYLDTLVLAGGWVPFIYHYHLDRSTTERAPLTRGVDIVTPSEIPIRGDSIDTVLKKAGLECDFRSRSAPPLTAYIGHLGDHEVEIEFLTYASGDKEDIVHVQKDLTAQSLHYLNLISDNTWAIEIDRISKEDPPLHVLVPTPGAFLLHKGIVYRKRNEKLKKAKDLFYLFYVFTVFREEWSDWIADDIVKLAKRYPKWLHKMIIHLGSDFSSAGNPIFI